MSNQQSEVKLPKQTTRQTPVIPRSSSSSSQQTPVNAPRADQGAIGNDRAPIVSDEKLAEFITSLYAIDWSEDDLMSVYDLVKYKGFDRNVVLKQLVEMNLTKRVLMELVLVCSLQGPQRAARTRLSNGKTPSEMNIPASGGQGRMTVTCNKISAATADLAAFYMKKVGAPKRLNIDLPAWLQFPSAGSIKMPQHYRDAHMEFNKRFSVIIGGSFNEQIYMQMVANAYLDEKLNLFA